MSKTQEKHENHGFSVKIEKSKNTQYHQKNMSQSSKLQSLELKSLLHTFIQQHRPARGRIPHVRGRRLFDKDRDQVDVRVKRICSLTLPDFTAVAWVGDGTHVTAPSMGVRDNQRSWCVLSASSGRGPSYQNYQTNNIQNACGSGAG